MVNWFSRKFSLEGSISSKELSKVTKSKCVFDFKKPQDIFIPKMQATYLAIDTSRMDRLIV